VIGKHQVLGLIPARGGSKGITRKNVRSLGGKPLIAWTIDEAKKSQYIDRLVVSTDDEEISQVARSYGADVPFVRPQELATDEARGIDVVLHACGELPTYDTVVLLQPTSPFRVVEDIDKAIEEWFGSGKTVVSVAEVSKSPYWMYELDANSNMHAVLQSGTRSANRQDLPRVYALNGAVYVAACRALDSTAGFIGSAARAFVMPYERSLDLDTELDWRVAECLVSVRA
jgi:N-acylneuraminate cytidylyltransferase